MRQSYSKKLKANVTLDTEGRVRGINHVDEFWLAKEQAPRQAALSYIRQVSGTLEIPGDQFDYAHQAVDFFNPLEQDTQFRLSEVKSFFDSSTLGYYQTHLNVPVWAAGLTVTIKQNPTRVLSAVNTSIEDVKAKLPSDEVIERWRKIFKQTDVKNTQRRSGLTDELDEPEEGTFVGEMLSGYVFKQSQAKAAKEARKDAERAYIRSGRFFIYRYDPDARFKDIRGSGQDEKDRSDDERKQNIASPLVEEPDPRLPIAPVSDDIEPGQDYLVAEIVFFYPTSEWGEINWRALVELETGSILYLRPLSSHINGLVFNLDPVSESGNTANGPTATSAVLDGFRDDELLLNLDAPVAGTQSLSGTWATLSEEETPTISSPTQSAGNDFDYGSRTNNFAAVNAYYHTNRFFELVEDLGFTLSTYFDGTTFPVPVDHRGLGDAINAHCVGTGTGIDHLCYALADASDTTNPIGIATDWRVHLHELGGHGILHDHVGGPNFGFAHSAGDSMAVILADPESQAPDRFVLAPFVPAVNRRFDRPVSSWAWNGANDVGGYPSEEILATTLFRVYRSIGGDSTALSRREFAARYMAYLILRSVSTLTPMTNPSDALSFANTMISTDLNNWISEGVDGGAYGKVIRWSFEKQGLYQPGTPTTGSVTTEGDPPDVDVYIDDGRAGEYEYLGNHWSTSTIWNRLNPDSGTTHETPVLGTTNYLYVKVKNRGTQQASNVKVRGFHTKPMAGLLWPDDFDPLTTPEITVGTLNANNTEEQTVGPFEWTPNENAYGHDCLLMIVSATSDPSNIDNFTAGEVIPEWRLVPNDNNVGQRNVYPVPGGGGTGSLVSALHGISFWVGNPNPRSAVIEVKVKLPELLKKRGWNLSFQGLPKARFQLASREQRELVLKFDPGRDIDRSIVENASDRDIEITATADGAVIGGMVYHVDPTITHPRHVPGESPKDGRTQCHEQAKKLLECLDLPGQDVCDVRVRNINVDIKLNRDDCC